MSKIFDWNEYQAAAQRTARRVGEIRGDLGATLATIEVLVAAGDLADLLKKQVFYRRETTVEQYLSAIEDIRVALSLLESSVEVSLNSEDVLPLNEKLFHGTLGALGEEAEMLEALLVQAHNDEDHIDRTNVIEEAGDSLWYQAEKLAGVEELTGFCPLEVANVNIAKLKARYPDKFSEERAVGRDLAEERRVLEAGS